MATKEKQYYTLDRDPESDEWDTCPTCEETLLSRGEDQYRDDYDIYEYFVCENGDCPVREVIGRYRKNEPERDGRHRHTSRFQ